MTIENHSYAHYCVFFSFPHQTSFLLYKCRFDEVNFTRRCFHDGNISLKVLLKAIYLIKCSRVMSPIFLYFKRKGLLPVNW